MVGNAIAPTTGGTGTVYTTPSTRIGTTSPSQQKTADVLPQTVSDDGAGQAEVASSVPFLMEASTDASSMLNAFLAIKTQNDNNQVQDSLTSIRETGQAKHDQNQEVIADMDKAAAQQAEAGKSSLAMKILGWVGVALTVVAAVAISIASFGTATMVAAIAVAAVVVTMTALQESGQMDKWQGQIADDLQKEHPDWSPEKCKNWAMGIMITIQVTVTVACIATGAGAAKLAGTVADATSTAVRIAAGIGRLATGANAVTSASSATMQGVAGYHSYEASLAQAAEMMVKKFLAQLQNKDADEEARLQTMVKGQAKMWANITDMCKNAEHSMLTTLNVQQQSQVTG